MNAMEQAVQKALGLPKRMNVKIINEDAMRLLNALIHGENPLTAGFVGSERHIDIYLSVDGRPLAHKIVLDARGMWSVHTVVTVDA